MTWLNTPFHYHATTLPLLLFALTRRSAGGLLRTPHLLFSTFTDTVYSILVRANIPDLARPYRAAPPVQTMDQRFQTITSCSRPQPLPSPRRYNYPFLLVFAYKRSSSAHLLSLRLQLVSGATSQP